MCAISKVFVPVRLHKFVSRAISQLSANATFLSKNYNFFFATLEISLSFMAFSECNAQF